MKPSQLQLLIHCVMVVFKCLLVRHKRFLRSNHLYFASLHNNNPNFMFTLTLEENGNFQRCEKRFLIVRGKTRMSNKILPKLFMHTYLVCGKVFLFREVVPRSVLCGNSSTLLECRSVSSSLIILTAVILQPRQYSHFILTLVYHLVH